MNSCIVGYGAIGPVHAKAISDSILGKVYAVCEILPERAEKCSLEYGCIIYNDFDEMLKDKNIDVVHICTPHYLHAQMAIKALNANKNVVIEKPVVMLEDELKPLREALEKSKGKLCVVMQNRKNPCIEKLLSVLKSGEEGELLTLFGVLRWVRTQDYYDSEPWRGKWKTEGGGVVINQAVHLLDMLCLLGGNVKNAVASISNKGLPKIEVEDTADALIDFENGVRATFYATNLNLINSPYLIEARFENCLYRYGDGILIRISDDNVTLIERDENPTSWKSYWGMGHGAVVNEFYDAIVNNTNDYVKLEDVENTMKVMFEFYKNK